MSVSKDYVILDSLKEYLSDYLNQVFVIDSLVKVSKAMIASERTIKEAMDATDSFIPAESWLKCAKEALERFQPLYEPPSNKAETTSTSADNLS